MWFLFLLSAFALLLDLILHISTFFGLDPQSLFHPEWPARLAFFGLFYFIIITAAFASHTHERRAKLLGLVLPDQTPPWLRKMIRLTVAYAFLWLFVGAFSFMHAHGNAVRLPDGSYAVDSGHGRPPVPITFQRFHHLRVRSAQSLSGFFLMFYIATTAQLLLAVRHPEPPSISITPIAQVQSASPSPLSYTSRGNGLLLHMTLHFALLAIFMVLSLAGGVLAMAYLTLRNQTEPISFGRLLLILACIVVGGVFPALILDRILARHFPARCPHCRGRAYCISSKPGLYLCHDCGRLSEP